MTVSHLTRSRNQLWSDLVGELGGSGSNLTLSEEELIAAARNTYGGTISAKTTSRADLIASLVNAAGGSVSSATHSETEMMAALANALGGSVSALTGSFNSNLAASVNAAASEGGGGEEYVASAISISDSDTSLRCASLSCSDNSLFSFSMWVKADSFPEGKTLFVADPEGAYCAYLACTLGGKLDNLYAPVPPQGGEDLELWSSIAAPTGSWIHLLGSSDTNHAINSKPIKLYINDVDRTAVQVDGAAAFLTTFDGMPFFVVDDSYSDGLVCDLADVRIMPGVSLLDGSGDIPLATRRLFIDENGKPVDPAVATSELGAPCILFSGDAETFATNQGTGGTFTLTGALTNASTSPSD